MSVRVFLPLLVLAGLALGPATTLAEEGVPVPVDTARGELDILAAKVKSKKSINEEITAALDAVSNAYHNLEAPAAPELQEVPEGASDEEKSAIESGNKKLEDQHKTAMTKFEREQDKFRKDAEKLFLKALKLQKIHRRSERNIRDDVNIKAAQVLGQTGNPSAARAIQKMLETTIFKAKYEVPMQLLEECFGALGKIGELDSLEWMTKEFTHSKSSPRSNVDQLIAAHKAMILYTPPEEIPGALRQEVVNRMVKTYSGTESLAQQSSTDKNVQAAKVFWDRIKNDAIKVVQHFSLNPKNEDEEVLATMLEFQTWLRNHKNVKKFPWKLK